MQVTLNSVWKLAMPPLSIAEFQNERADRVLDRINDDQKHDRADQVEVAMDHRGSAGVFGTADRRQERRDAGADVLTEDNSCIAAA